MTRRFNLLRWFAALSLGLVVLVAIGSAAIVSRLVTQSVITRDIEISMDLIQRYVQAEQAYRYFTSPQLAADRAAIERFFEPLAHLPDVARVNVYGADRLILWSSIATLIGRGGDANPALDAALAGVMTVGIETAGEAHEEPASVEVAPAGTRYIEAYVPIHGADRATIVGAVELYRVPKALQSELVSRDRLIWIGAGVGGLALYGALVLVVMRAGRLIGEQESRLAEAEAYAAVGEMASAVAHGVRNPLASIRSSAELALDGDAATVRESARDIVHEVDRLDRWVRGLLAQAQPDADTGTAADVNAVLRQSLLDLAPSIERQKVDLKVELEESAPKVKAGAALGQVFDCLIGNALEATPPGGRIRVTTRKPRGRGMVEVKIADTGPGIARANLARVFRPFYTTKRGGLGLGLGLSRRIVSRTGGSLSLESHQGRGTTAIVLLPAAEADA